MRKKRGVVFALVLALLMIFAAACSGGSSGSSGSGGSAGSSSSGSGGGSGSSGGQGASSSSGGAQQETVELRVSWWGGDSRHQKWNEMLDKFEEKYPHIKVSREFTDYNGYWDKLATQTAGGNAPDVIMQVMHMFAQYAGRGQLMELDGLIAEGKIDLSDWPQSIIDSGKLNGKTYMVSYGNTSNAVLYNADMFAQAGIPEPAPHWTWDDFVRTAKEIQAKLPEGVWAIEDLGGYDMFFLNYLLSMGKPGLYSEDGKLGFTEEDMIAYFTLWDDLRKSGATPPPSVQAEYPSERPEQTMLAQGKVTMFVRPFNQLVAFQSGTTARLELAMVPTGVRGGHDLGGAYISINAKTKYPEESLLLLNFFISDMDAANIMKMEYGPMGSARMNESLRPILPEPEQKGIEFMDIIKDSIVVQTQPPAGSSEITKQFALANEAVAFGQKTIEEAVRDFFNEASKILN